MVTDGDRRAVMPGVDLERFARDGFAVVPGALDEAQVRALRQDLLAARPLSSAVGGGRVLFDPGASIATARGLFTGSETLAVVRSLVGDRVLDVHQSAAHFGPVNRGWHKDNVDYMRGKLDGDDYADDYRVVHLAWYLQDHASHGGGTSFRIGSQRTPDDRRGAPVSPDVRAGDLVAFDLRTTHFGNTLRLRRGGRPVFLDPLWRLPGRWARLTPWAASALAVRALPGIFMPEHGDRRVVLFAMYGADNRHTQRLFDWLRTQPDLRHVLRYEGPTPLT